MGKTELEGVGLSLSEQLDRLNKLYGKGTVIAGDSADALALRVQRWPTDVFALDYATAGGLPHGRITLVSGQKGSWKSTLSLGAIAAWQRETANGDDGPKAAWIDQEGVFDPDWADAIGVDRSRLLVSRPKYAEEGIDVACTLLSTTEVEFLAYDSIAAMVTAVELEASANDKQQADQSKVVNKWMRQVPGILNAWSQKGTPRTVILLNQLRQKLGGFGKRGLIQWTEPGGLGQIFAASLCLRMRRKVYEWEKEAHQADGTGPLCALNGFKVEQSKVSPPHLEGEFRGALRTTGEGEYVRTRVNGMELFLKHAQRIDFLRKQGKGWVLGTELGTMLEARTKEALVTQVREDATLRRKMEAELIAACYALV